MITIQNADAALKDYYLDAVNTQLNNNISPFFSAIEKNTDNVYGKDVKLSVIRGSSGSVVAGAEDADLPDPYKNRYANITMPLKNIYGTIEISDKAMRASRESTGAFVNLVNAEMDGLIASAKHNFNRMLFGNGSGMVCRITSKVSGTKYGVSIVKDYFVGMKVDVYTIANNLCTGGSGIFIDAVDVEAGTVTLSASITDSVVNGSIFLHGARNSELTGLGALFDNATLYGYTKSSDPYFKPYIVDGDGKLTETLLSDIIDHMEESYNSRINMIICSFKTRKKIAALADANRRVVNTIDVRAGYGTVSVNDVPVYADKYCPDDRILFLNSDDFALYQLCDWEWLEDEDGKILKQIPGKAAYSATLVKYAELICRKPCGQAMLKNFVTVSTGTSEGTSQGASQGGNG